MDIYSALKADHEKVLGLIDELLELSESDDYRDVLVQQIKDELIPHSRAEESVFYNSIRAVGPDSSPVMHSFREHMEAEALLESLVVQEKVDLDWKKTARKFKDALEHHISEEEGKIFRQARSLFSEDEARMMGEAFSRLKGEISDHGMIRNVVDVIKNLMPPRWKGQLEGLEKRN